MCKTILIHCNIGKMSLWHTYRHIIINNYPLFECVKSLSKFTQRCDIFISDFVTAINVCETNLFQMFIDPIMKYEEKDRVGRAFLNIVDHGNDVGLSSWLV